jgi:hypothetical protein
VWDTYEAIVEACASAWRFLIDDPDRIRSIAYRDWAWVNLLSALDLIAATAAALHLVSTTWTVRKVPHPVRTHTPHASIETLHEDARRMSPLQGASDPVSEH